MDLACHQWAHTRRRASNASDLPARSVVYENPESWGLRDAPPRPLDERTTWLDFSWEAVPPLVDLRRLVLPAARVGQAHISDAVDS